MARDSIIDPNLDTFKIGWSYLWSVLSHSTTYRSIRSNFEVIAASLWKISWEPLRTQVKAASASKGRMCCPSFSSSKHASPLQASASWSKLMICSMPLHNLQKLVYLYLSIYIYRNRIIRAFSWFMILDLILDCCSTKLKDWMVDTVWWSLVGLCFHFQVL